MMPDRSGKRVKREQRRPQRTPYLGYYIIITDTKETEQNYLDGLKETISPELQDKLVIKVSRAKSTDHLVEEVKNQASFSEQYREPWIVFDRDQVTNFDKIINEAEQNNISVGWSNPCIEIWFSAYFNKMPVCNDSVRCCDDFGDLFYKETKQHYEKSDIDIYKKLNNAGDEKEAIKFADRRLKNCHESKPSEMLSCTTLYKLIDEIKSKVKNQ